MSSEHGCLYNVNNSTALVLGTFPGKFPATGIKLLLVAVIVNLMKMMISHPKTPLV